MISIEAANLFLERSTFENQHKILFTHLCLTFDFFNILTG